MANYRIKEEKEKVMTNQGAKQLFEHEYREALVTYGRAHESRNMTPAEAAFGVAVARLTAELVAEKMKEGKEA